MIAVGLVAVAGAVSPAAATSAAGRSAARAARTTTPPAPPAPPAATIVVDAGSGRVLSATNERQPLPPASLTKILTALVAVDRLAPDGQVHVSERAARSPAFVIGMKAGQVWPESDAVTALLVGSANDAAVALAEESAGSLDGFEQAATELARHLGLSDDPVIRDPAGLDDSFSVAGGNRISARDLAVAARDLFAQPMLAAIVATRVATFTEPDGLAHKVRNHNYRFLDAYAGAIGGKTGYTRLARQCLMSAATRDGRTLIAVVLGAHGDPLPVSTGLLDAAFAQPAGAAGTGDVLPPVVGDLGPARLRTTAEAAARGTGAGSAGTAGSAAMRPPAAPASGLAPAGGDPFGTFDRPAVMAAEGVLGAAALTIVARRRQIRRRKRRRRGPR